MILPTSADTAVGGERRISLAEPRAGAATFYWMLRQCRVIEG